jgi:hypothetical protein
MTPASLTPRLTPFDESVLIVLPTVRGLRAERVADLVLGAPCHRCASCGRITPVGGISARRRRTWETPRWMTSCATWAGGCGGTEHPVLIATPEQRREVREVLRGLERIGAAYQAGGWWRRA